jgi:hypothetical protein
LAAASRIALEVAVSQHVVVELLDVVGRRVAVVHDGILPAGRPHSLAVGAEGLPAGTYVVVATGETFVATRRATVVR